MTSTLMMLNLSAIYTGYKESIGTNSHPRFNATVTYAFGHGKKVQQDNEVGEQSGASSAIMKQNRPSANRRQ